jgi:hypothetical protein
VRVCTWQLYNIYIFHIQSNLSLKKYLFSWLKWSKIRICSIPTWHLLITYNAPAFTVFSDVFLGRRRFLRAECRKSVEAITVRRSTAVRNAGGTPGIWAVGKQCLKSSFVGVGRSNVGERRGPGLSQIRIDRMYSLRMYRIDRS